MDPDARPAPVIPTSSTVRPGLDRIDLKQLEHVVEICRAGGFSAAARRLRLSQPALSKSVSRLETQLGVLLFKRAGGAARPTEFGELIAERGRALLDSASALSRELEQRVGHVTGRLRIGIGPSTRHRPMPQVIRGLAAHYPDLRLDLRVDDAPAIMRGVNQGRYDLAFGYSEYAEPYGELIRVKIFEDRLAIVARPGHPATLAAKPLTAEELMRYPLASVGPTSSFDNWLGDLTDSRAGELQALVCNDLELLQICLPDSHVLRGPHFVFERELASGELVEAPVEWQATYHCWMLTTPENWRLPVVKAVADMARGLMP
jgi:DNA-binding transcriptional LysR family regulator